MLVYLELRGERSYLGDTTKDIKVKYLRHLLRILLNILLSKGHTPRKYRICNGTEADLAVFCVDFDSVTNIRHILDHFLEFSRVYDDWAVIAFWEFDIECLDALDFDVGYCYTGLLLGDDLDT